METPREVSRQGQVKDTRNVRVNTYAVSSGRAATSRLRAKGIEMTRPEGVGILNLLTPRTQTCIWLSNSVYAEAARRV